jgi:hypothetical protein
VSLSSDFASYLDASSGCLKPGDVGVIVKDDNDHKPFKVNFQGSDWFYAEKALVRATEVLARVKIHLRPNCDTINSSFTKCPHFDFFL